jgi:hypothetical protein
VTVRVAVWLVPPLTLAETMTVVVPGGVPVLPPPLLPALLPHEARASANPSRTRMPSRRRPRRERLPHAAPNTGSRKAYATCGPRLVLCNAADVGAVVAMVSAVVADLPPLGVTVCGLKPQLDSAGKPLHVKLTAEPNTFSGMTVNVAVPFCPALIVREVGLAEGRRQKTLAGWHFIGANRL